MEKSSINKFTHCSTKIYQSIAVDFEISFVTFFLQYKKCQKVRNIRIISLIYAL